MPLPDDEWSKQFGQFQGLLGPTDEEKKQAMNMGLLSAGLGILANNRGHYGAFGPAVGVGLQQGMQGYQQALQSGVEQREKGMANALRMQEIQRLTRQGDIQNRRLDLDEKRLQEGKKGQAATAKMMLPGFLKSAGISGQGFDIDEDGELVPVAMNEAQGSIQPVSFDTSWMKEAGDDYKAMIAQGLQHPDKAVQRQAMNEAFKYYRESRQPAKPDKVPSSIAEFRAIQSMAPEEREAFMQYENSRKKPLVDMRGANFGGVASKEASKTQGKEFGKFAVEATQSAQSAADAASDVGMVVHGLRGMGGGPVAEFKAWAGKVLPADSEWGKVASMGELAKTVQTKLAPQMRAVGSGATSDFEMKAYMASIPTLATTERGRDLMGKYAQRIADRAQARAEIINDIEQEGKLPTPAVISARMKMRLKDAFFDEDDKAFFGIGGKGNAAASFPAPNQAAINDLKLRRNDKAAQRDFDAAFGPGASARVLGGK